MYYVSLLDRNNNEFDIFCSKSQCDLDKFTTLFVNSKAILNQLNLNSKDVSVLLQKRKNFQRIQASLKLRSTAILSLPFLLMNEQKKPKEE